MPVETRGILFTIPDLSQFLDERVMRLSQSIDSEGRDILNNGDAVAARLLEEYRMEPVRVDKSATRLKLQERIPLGERIVSFLVPFTGSGELLMYHPSSYTSGVVFGQTNDGCIVVDIVNAAGDDHEPFRREFDSWYANMEKWLEGANNQANRFNSLLPSEIRDRIDASVNAFRSGGNIASALGYAETPIVGGPNTERTTAPPESEGVDLTIPEREDQFNEFKETFSVPTKEQSHFNDIRCEVVKTVAAFANAEGGRLFIGVNDDGRVTGLKKDLDKNEKSPDKLESAIRDYLGSMLDVPVDMRFAFSGDDYLVIEVDRLKSDWVYMKYKNKSGQFAVRRGNESPILVGRGMANYQREHPRE